MSAAPPDDAEARRFRELFVQARDTIVVNRVEPDGRVVCEDLNPAGERASGFGRAEVVGRDVFELLPADEAALMLARYRECLRTRAPVSYQQEFTLPVGRRVFDGQVIPLLDAQGAVWRLAIVGRDISALKAKEDARRCLDAQEAEVAQGRALEALAERFAHDVNNVLSVVAGHASAAQAGLTDPKQALEAILAAAHGARALTHEVVASSYAAKATAPAQAAALEAPTTALQGAVGLGRHLLLVDDHPGMVRVTARLFETIGYRATPYDDPVEALEAFRAGPGDFDALVTDLWMPKLSGLELTRAVRSLRPGFPVLFSSGRALEKGETEGQVGQPCAVLLKPWRLEEALAALGRLLPVPPTTNF